jgi:hypothetical protein
LPDGASGKIEASLPTRRNVFEMPSKISLSAQAVCDIKSTQQA